MVWRNPYGTLRNAYLVKAIGGAGKDGRNRKGGASSKMVTERFLEEGNNLAKKQKLIKQRREERVFKTKG